MGDVWDDVWSDREMALISWLGHRVPLWLMIACAIIAGGVGFAIVLESQINTIKQNIVEMRIDIASKVTASDRRDQIDLVLNMIGATNKRIEDATTERNVKLAEVNERLRYIEMKVDRLTENLSSQHILPPTDIPPSGAR